MRKLFLLLAWAWCAEGLWARVSAGAGRWQDDGGGWIARAVGG